MLIYTHTKSKVKRKLAPKAEREQYTAWCKKHGIDDTKKRKRVTSVTNPVVVTTPYVRETTKGTSLGTFVTGPVNLNSAKKVYTGDNLLGIGAMHKSNLVPIFSEESAVDISRMRR